MLVAGELAATVGMELDHPQVKPLIADPLEAGLAALNQRGHYPINHTIVVRDELLDVHPQLAADIFEAFAASKRLYVDRLKAGGIDRPTDADAVHRRVMEIIGDPLPYGIDPNRAMIEQLIQHAMTQGIISRPFAVDDLFARGTRKLVG
jgi:4,5-dihydroxyphthalate decarboxylase